MEDRLSYLSGKFEEYGFSFSEQQKRQFYTFYELLIEWNQKMNLTSITEFDEVVKKHFIDSLFINKIIDLNYSLKILDLGTGAGFPGIPLKIAFPEIKITLMDSLNKRITFLNEVIKELKLTSVETVHARAEDLANDKLYREKFDLCVSRAVANLSTLSEYCIPFIRIGGKFVSYKSGEVKSEAEASKKACYLLGGELTDIYRFEIEDNKRSFIIIEKVRSTPEKYPRKSGTPSRIPLK